MDSVSGKGGIVAIRQKQRRFNCGSELCSRIGDCDAACLSVWKSTVESKLTPAEFAYDFYRRVI